MRAPFILGAALAVIPLAVCAAPTRPVQPPSTMVWRAHEPAGMTPLIDSPFDSVAITDEETVEGWTFNGVGSLRRTSDATAPVSPPSVSQFIFSGSLSYGSGPATLAYRLPPGYTKLYLTFAVRLSSNFFGPGHQKLFYIYGAGNSPLPAAVVEFSVPQRTTGPVYPFVETENTGGADRDYWPRSVADIGSRGKWHEYEVYIALNDPGFANGTLKFWLDGVEQSNSGATPDGSSLQLIPVGGTKQVVEVDFSPTYGGGGTPMSPPATQYIYLDHVYISVSK